MDTVSTLKLIKTDKNGQIKTYQRTDDSTSIYPQLKTPLFMQFLQWYTYWLIKCAEHSGELTTAFIHAVFQEKLHIHYWNQNFSLKFFILQLFIIY